MPNPNVKQAIMVAQSAYDPSQMPERLAMFNEDGTPVTALTFSDVPTGADVVLTGYTTAAWSAVSATDTVNQAIAKVANFRVASNVVLTGYTIGAVALAPLGATDTVNAALAKLEKRVADLEAA